MFRDVFSTKSPADLMDCQIVSEGEDSAPKWGEVKRGLCRAMSSQMAKPAFHPPVCCTFRCDWGWNDLLALVCAHAVGLAAFAARAVCVCAHAVGLSDLCCAGATLARRGHAYGPLGKPDRQWLAKTKSFRQPGSPMPSGVPPAAAYLERCSEQRREA